MDADWSYDSRARCWRLALAGWTACRALARLTEARGPDHRSGTPGHRLPHVFVDMQAAQDWCLREITRQAPVEA
jgi:hypothetical protein